MVDNSKHPNRRVWLVRKNWQDTVSNTVHGVNDAVQSNNTANAV